MRIYVNCVAQNPITKCLGNTDDDNVVKEYFWVIQKKKKKDYDDYEKIPNKWQDLM